jgi:hypothetical protein
MRAEGWCEGHALALSEEQLRVLYKQMWANVVGGATRPPFALTIDEQRVLSGLFLARPRLPPSRQASIDLDRAGAKSDRECASVEAAERRAMEQWLIDRITRLSVVDPEYPAAYARGVAHFQGGSFVPAMRDFRQWLQDHPDGPLALRARGYLRAAEHVGALE